MTMAQRLAQEAGPVKLRRRLVVLDLIRVSPESVSYSDSQDREVSTHTSILMCRDTYEEMGRPENVTVSVRPGNQLTESTWRD